MGRRIGHIRWFFLFAGLLLCGGRAVAQFYVSPKTCAADPGVQSQTGNQPPQGACANNILLFDDDKTSVASTWQLGNGQTFQGRLLSQPLQAGNYTIQLQRTFADGSSATVSKTIQVRNPAMQRPLFNKKTKADTTVCDKSTLTLNPYKLNLPPQNVAYRWFPKGETTATIDVTESGCYSVEVTDLASNCSYTAVIEVKFCMQPASQKGGGGEQWYFGNKASLSFNQTSTKTPVNDPAEQEGKLFLEDEYTETDLAFSPTRGKDNAVNTPEAVAMVYDPSGGLKFYTDGRALYTAENQAVPLAAGGAVNLNINSTQGLALVPKIACLECNHHQYYLFGVDKTTGFLKYWLIDSRYNNGQGAVVEEAVPIGYPIPDRLAVAFDPDLMRYVLFTHQKNSNKLLLYSVDANGLELREQATAATIEDTPQYSYIALSPDNKKLAMAIQQNGEQFIEIYELNIEKVTVNLAQRFKLEAGMGNAYGVSFGAESATILYISTQGNPSRLWQYDLSRGQSFAIEASRREIASSANPFGAIQRGPIKGDGKKYLYVAIQGRGTIAYLQDPDKPGNATLVGYTPNKADVGGTTQLGLPQLVYAKQKSDGEGIQGAFNGTCQGLPTLLTISPVCGPMRNKIKWIMPDGTRLQGENVAYRFPNAGPQVIRVEITTFNPSPLKQFAQNQVLSAAIQLLETECIKKVIQDTIFIRPSPRFTVPDTAYTCTREAPPLPAVIDPKATGGSKFTYSWLTGTGSPIAGASPTLAVLRTQASGNYSLQIENEFGCKVRKDFQIEDKCMPILGVPTAFTPNNDGINDTFEVKIRFVDFYEIFIFNRWGELVYKKEKTRDLVTSIGPTEDWDGTVNQKVVPVGLYPYVIRYLSSDFREKGIQEQKGTVTVLK